jgi:hypothetical protein
MFTQSYSSLAQVSHTPRSLHHAACASLLLGMLVALSGTTGCAKARRDLGVPIVATSDQNLLGQPISIENVSGLDWSKVALDIDNQRGTVNILVSPSIIQPIVIAGSPGETEERRRVDFVTAQLNNDGPQPVLRVVASSPGQQAAKIVNITIELPALGGLRIRNSDGRIYAKGISGAVDIVNTGPTRSGGTTVIMASPANDPITIRAASGGIDLRLAAGTAAQVIAQSRTGIITLDLASASVTNSVAATALHTATLNGGTTPITAAADTGNVTIMYGRN